MNTFEPANMDRDDRPVEECGVIGVSSPAGEQTAQLAFFGLFALQLEDLKVEKSFVPTNFFGNYE
mgnify:CR=1 FL=1